LKTEKKSSITPEINSNRSEGWSELLSFWMLLPKSGMGKRAVYWGENQIRQE
jgi:hypothetical protein